MPPSNWIPLELGDLADFKSGGTPSKQRPEFWGGGLPWVSAKDLKQHRLNSSIDTLSEQGFEQASVAPPGASLILVRGMTLLKDFPVGYATRPMAFNQDLKAVIANDQVDSEFLSYLLVGNSHKIRQLVSTAGHGTGRLDSETLKCYPINLPTKSEQKEIAQILSTWDRAIEITEKLIGNSKGQKKALMQQLLTGKGRLQGFSGDWQECRFGTVFNRLKRKNDIGNDNVLTISGKDGLVSQRDYFNKRVASENLEGYTLLNRGDFAYNKSYSAGYPYGAIKPLEHYDAGVVSSLYICFNLIEPDQHSQSFFRHFFEGGYFDREIYAIAQEGARNHGLLNVSATDFFNTRLTIPTLREQIAISEVLNLAENAQLNLEKQLKGLEIQKKALMQQLLTGKRRVRLEEKVTA